MPDNVEPETRLFLNLFRDGPSIEFNAARKRLKGSGITLEEIEELGWALVKRKDSERIAEISSVGDRWPSLSRKKSLSKDLDQVHFAINCCLGNRQLDGKPADLEAWIEINYKSIMPSVGSLLKYFENNHFGADYKQAIGVAYRTLERTLQKIKDVDGEFKHASAQMNLFDN
jgi:hypothetical protein